jgi:hypothetical protein
MWVGVVLAYHVWLDIFSNILAVVCMVYCQKYCKPKKSLKQGREKASRPLANRWLGLYYPRLAESRHQQKSRLKRRLFD